MARNSPVHLLSISVELIINLDKEVMIGEKRKKRLLGNLGKK